MYRIAKELPPNATLRTRGVELEAEDAYLYTTVHKTPAFPRTRSHYQELKGASLLRVLSNLAAIAAINRMSENGSKTTADV
jgi:hypothetical protein